MDNKKKRNKKQWEKYEDATRQLLYDVRAYLKVHDITSKQKMAGKSGTEWEIEVSCYNVANEKIVLVECKQRGKQKLSQETVGGFAYRIKDIGGDKGIIVTTIGLQKGAEKVAKAENITTIILDYNSTNENYIARIANDLFLRNTDRVLISESIQTEIT